jgi:hypothetical protein
MAELVPIKVKIGLKANGHADYPDWTQMPMIINDQDMRTYCPDGWMYDKSSGHQEETLDSPRGQQWGYLLGTRAFVDQAKTTFPTLITELTEAEFETIYEENITAHIPENKYDEKVLTGLKTELDLKTTLLQDTAALKTKIAKALDPNDTEPGIKKDKTKKWTDFKALRGITIEKV